MLNRRDETRLDLPNDLGIDVTVFARPEVPIESNAVDELTHMLELGKTVERLIEKEPAFFGHASVGIQRVAVTPDFHKGAGIPIGTVMATRGFLVPAAIGNDVNCGMRVHRTGLTADQVTSNLDSLETTFRHLFFEGGRDIPMTRLQREALFREGLMGLLDAVPTTQTDGLWSLFHQLDIERDLEKIHSLGSMPAQRVYGLDDFLGPPSGFSRDDQIGSVGGGNHFVEIQSVDKILDGAIAHAWGLKKNQVLVMVHTGSLMIGHLCGALYRDAVRRIFPASVTHPSNGIFPLPLHGPFEEQTSLFRDALHNAANFAFANRMFLALMAIGGLHTVLGDCSTELLYDAPHNLVWDEEVDGVNVCLHRKGACPARGLSAMNGTPFAFYGEPVLVPGSMGASSFILAGSGNVEALSSASHGAGRQLSRGQAAKTDDARFREFMDAFRIVSPVDFRRPDIRMRPDIANEKLADLKKEAPWAYKGIGPIVRTLEEAGIARPVAELRPLMTLKG